MGQSFDLGKVVGEMVVKQGYADETFQNELSTAGCLGWYYKDLSKISDTIYQLTICDKMGQAVTDCVLANGVEISFKADYSACFCGTMDFTNRAIGLVQVTLYNTLPSNWKPEEHEYDYDTTVEKPGRGYLWVPMNPGHGKVPIGEGAVAFGSGCIANEIGAFASGRYNLADGRYSFASGNGNTAGYASHAEGYSTKATGLQSHSEGYYTEATGNTTHAEGRLTKATASSAHSEGYNTKATGDYSHAEGKNAEASAEEAHAEGLNTKASGKWGAHAEGEQCKATGNSGAHAEGLGSEANHTASHAEGKYSKTGLDCQHVQGQYNKQLGSGWVDVIGWGSSSTRKNISALDSSGNLHIKGKLYQGATNNDCTNGYLMKKPMEKKDDVTFAGQDVEKTYSDGLSDVVVIVKLPAGTTIPSGTYPTIRIYNGTTQITRFALNYQATALTNDAKAYAKSIYDAGVRWNSESFEYKTSSVIGHERVYPGDGFMVLSDNPVTKVKLESFVSGMTAEIYGRDW